jgi:hypothetical protein
VINYSWFHLSHFARGGGGVRECGCHRKTRGTQHHMSTPNRRYFQRAYIYTNVATTAAADTPRKSAAFHLNVKPIRIERNDKSRERCAFKINSLISGRAFSGAVIWKELALLGKRWIMLLFALFVCYAVYADAGFVFIIYSFRALLLMTSWYSRSYSCNYYIRHGRIGAERRLCWTVILQFQTWMECLTLIRKQLQPTPAMLNLPWCHTISSPFHSLFDKNQPLFVGVVCGVRFFQQIWAPS